MDKELYVPRQSIRLKRGRKQAVKETKYPFLFRGLIKCAVSNRQVTCDLKKGKYVYLIAHDPENPKRKLWVKECDVLEQLEEVFKSIQLPAELLPDVVAHINKMHDTEKQYHRESIKTLNVEMEQINAQMDRLTDLLINETINKEAYDRKFSQLQTRRKEVTVMLEEHQDGNEDFKNAITTMVSLASKAPDMLNSSKTGVKRALIACVFSNLQLNGAKLEYTLREPFRNFESVGEYHKWPYGIRTQYIIN